MTVLRTLAGLMAFSSLVVVIDPSVWSMIDNPRPTAILTFIVTSVIGVRAHAALRARERERQRQKQSRRRAREESLARQREREGRRAPPPPPGPRCSFCNRPKPEVRHLVLGRYGANICNECVELCAEVVKGAPERQG
jgi:hypothetical protein